MTAIGLFVAVPAVFGYNILLRRNKRSRTRCASSPATWNRTSSVACVRTWPGCPSGRRSGRRRGPQVTPSTPSTRGTTMSMNVPGSDSGEDEVMAEHQHHAAGGRDAGDADHLPDHHPGDRQDGEGADLPTPRNIPTQTKPENIPISAVDRDGKIYWNGALVADRAQAAEPGGRRSPQGAAAGNPHPRRPASALTRRSAACSTSSSSGGLVKVGFLTEPEGAGG